EDVLQDHAGREPREIDIALALDELAQGGGELPGLAAPDEILGEDARGVGKAVVGAGADRVDGGARVVVGKGGSGQGLAVGRVHGPNFTPLYSRATGRRGIRRRSWPSRPRA